MTHTRSIGASVLIAAVTFAAACGPKRIALPVRPGQSLTVLLPDSDTRSTGDARVSNASGAVDLADERDAALASANRRPVLGTVSEADVQRIFGDALSALPPAPQRFTVFFRFESDELTPESQALIPAILTAVKKHAVQDVVVIGHTDTTGAADRNVRLGLRRAMTVRDLLIASHLDRSTIEVVSYGETDLLVKTRDDVFEPRNRRVEITVR